MFKTFHQSVRSWLSPMHKLPSKKFKDTNQYSRSLNGFLGKTHTWEHRTIKLHRSQGLGCIIRIQPHQSVEHCHDKCLFQGCGRLRIQHGRLLCSVFFCWCKYNGPRYKSQTCNCCLQLMCCRYLVRNSKCYIIMPCDFTVQLTRTNSKCISVSTKQREPGCVIPKY